MSEKYFTYCSVQIWKILFRRFYSSGSDPPHKIMWYWFYYSISRVDYTHIPRYLETCDMNWHYCGSDFAPGASGLPYYCTSIYVPSCCNWRASCVLHSTWKPKPKKIYLCFSFSPDHHGQVEMFCTTIVPVSKGHLGRASPWIFLHDSWMSTSKQYYGSAFEPGYLQVSPVLRLHLCAFRLYSERKLCGFQTKKTTKKRGRAETHWCENVIR